MISWSTHNDLTRKCDAQIREIYCLRGEIANLRKELNETQETQTDLIKELNILLSTLTSPLP